MKLRYTRPALRDLDRLLATIAEQSPRGARRIQARLKTVIDLLQDYPNIGLLTNRKGMRRFVLSPFPYVVFYRATEDEIIIYGVRHGATIT